MFSSDFSRFLAVARGQGIEHMLCVAIDLESYPRMRELVDPYEEISVSVGVHPNEQSSQEPSVVDLVKHAQDPRVVAIGETGLDYYRSRGDLGWQEERFRRHIEAAKTVGKPLIIHSRCARDDTLKILEDEDAATVGGVFHCFTEDWEVAKRAIELNFYISFSGIVTFRNAQAIQEAAQRVPESRLLIETDSPYLAPIPHRGKPNVPLYVRHVAEQIAALRQESFERIAEITTRNFYTLFPAIRAV